MNLNRKLIKVYLLRAVVGLGDLLFVFTTALLTVSTSLLILAILDPRTRSELSSARVTDILTAFTAVLDIPFFFMLATVFVAIPVIKYYISTRPLRQKINNSPKASYIKLRRHYRFSLFKWTSSRITFINDDILGTSSNISADIQTNPHGLFIFEPGIYAFTVEPAVFRPYFARSGIMRRRSTRLRIKISALEAASSFKITIPIQPSSSYVIDLYTDKAEWSEESHL